MTRQSLALNLLVLSAGLFAGAYGSQMQGCTLPVPWVVPTPVNPPVVAGPIRSLLLYESSEAYTPGQQAAISSTAMRAYLDSHCEKDGATPAWRVWDVNVTPTPAFKASFDAAIAASAGQRPWLHIEQKSKPVFDGPVTTEADAIAALTKWGGP